MAEGIQIKNLPSTTTIKQGDTMTIVQDKQNKQLALDVFANESDLATLSPLENRCDEVKAKIEVDEYSAEITTSQSMSKIGTDDSGANLHENVLDGAFELCVLKGHTKYRDIDTGEILENFEESRNLELITVRMPILHTIGKNLFDISNASYGYITSTGEANTGKNNVKSAYIPIKPNTKYSINAVGSKVENSNFSWYDSNKNFIVRHQVTKTSISPDNAKYLIIHNNYRGAENIEDLTSVTLMLTEGDIAEYEPYKTSILSFNQKDDKTIVLRSLPNGVCDTLNLNTGEYVQRIEEHVLDGTTNNASRDWNICWNDYSTNTLTFEGYRPTKKLINTNEAATTTIPKNFICDKVKVLGFGSMWQSGQTVDRELSITTYTGGQLIFVIEKSKLTTMDVSGFKQWLSQNPVTIQYQLENPIITKVDVQGFPHAYKNGHIQLSSGSTESSLTPIVTYKVPVSRVGQIASNTKSNLRQTIKLNQLEVLVYQSLINTEYENLLVQNSVESATSFTNLSTNDPKDELYYMLKHLIEEDQPVQNMLDKINLFYLYGLLNDEHYFDLLLGGEEDVY